MVLPHDLPTPKFGSLKYIEYDMIQINLLTMIHFRDIDNT